MSFSLTYNGITLTPENGYTVQSINGLSNIDIRTSQADLLGRDGGNVFAQYFSQRIIEIEGTIIAQSADAYFSLRDALITAFNKADSNQDLTLTRWDSGATTRVIPARVLRMPDIQEMTGKITTNNFRITLICEDPFFLDNTENSETAYIASFTGYSIGTPSDFDFGNGGTVSGFDMINGSENTVVCVNSGAAAVYPTIRINAGGGLATATLTNVTTGVAFTINQTLAANAYVDISWSNTGVSVTLNGSSNIYANFAGELFDLAVGNNTIRFTTPVADNTANAVISWSNKRLTF